jgi:CHASE3 domain sensor protein
MEEHPLAYLYRLWLGTDPSNRRKLVKFATACKLIDQIEKERGYPLFDHQSYLAEIESLNSQIEALRKQLVELTVDKKVALEDIESLIKQLKHFGHWDESIVLFTRLERGTQEHNDATQGRRRRGKRGTGNI